MRLRSTCDRLRSLPLIPQLVQTPKSLISLALLAVSERCAIRSNFSRPLVGRVVPEPRRLDHGRAPRRRGCWYWPGKLCSPIVRRIFSMVANSWRSACNASPRRRVREYRPNSVSSAG